MKPKKPIDPPPIPSTERFADGAAVYAKAFERGLMPSSTKPKSRRRARPRKEPRHD